jgi:hypothetical protein
MPFTGTGTVFSPTLTLSGAGAPNASNVDCKIRYWTKGKLVLSHWEIKWNKSGASEQIFFTINCFNPIPNANTYPFQVFNNRRGFITPSYVGSSNTAHATYQKATGTNAVNTTTAFSVLRWNPTRIATESPSHAAGNDNWMGGKFMFFRE